MDALRIDFWLSTAMQVPPHPIHLDALLAYALTEDRLSRETASGDAAIRRLAEILPLEKAQQGEEWSWKASALLADGVLDAWQRMWIRKTDVYDLAQRYIDGQIRTRSKFPLKPYGLNLDTLRGLFKNHFQFYAVQQVTKLSAWCVGDGDEIEYLLKDAGWVTHIGARRRVDHGRIRQIDICEDEAAHHNWALRILPWQQDESMIPVLAGLHPPYWAPENRGVGYAPIEVFGLG